MSNSLRKVLWLVLALGLSANTMLAEATRLVYEKAGTITKISSEGGSIKVDGVEYTLSKDVTVHSPGASSVLSTQSLQPGMQIGIERSPGAKSTVTKIWVLPEQGQMSHQDKDE
ncbi:MAG: hypothetical protein HY028_02165 [Gammaproteobacteria bacterium]|nr:hypothetical protein [Gammaproteobacteria bacterium]